jgi:hypothetical protein
MANPEVDQDQRLRRPAGIRSLRLGGTRVSYVPDGAVQLPPRGWLPGTSNETWAAHRQYLDTSGSLLAFPACACASPAATRPGTPSTSLPQQDGG